MRTVFLSMQLSLDGYVAGPSGQPDFVENSFTPDLLNYVTDTMRDSDTILFGRVAFEEQSGHWPTATDDLAPMMNGYDKIVFSSTLKDVSAWQNSRLATAPLSEEIAQLKSLPGKNIFVSGGARLAQSLMREGLLDELRLYVHPVTVGSGIALFPDKQQLTLTDTKSLEGGVVLHTYRFAAN